MPIAVNRLSIRVAEFIPTIYAIYAACSLLLSSPSIMFSSSSSSSSSSSTTALASPVRRSPKVNQAPLSHLPPSDRLLFEKYGVGQKRTVSIQVVHKSFERHARLQPQAIAVEHSLFHHSLTYAALEKATNRLAHRLRTAGTIPGKRVVVLCRRSIYYVIGLLAVLKAGGQYVPLDAVTITDETLTHVIEDSGAALVLSMAEYVPRIRRDRNQIISLEDVIREDEQRDADCSSVEDLSQPSDGAFVIYTSGTTGKPKGVDVRHLGVTNGQLPQSFYSVLRQSRPHLPCC